MSSRCKWARSTASSKAAASWERCWTLQIYNGRVWDAPLFLPNASSEELCYLQPLVEITPPMWFRILACVLRFIRLAALLTSMYFACQYFVRYGPKVPSTDSFVF
eukprot:s780_g5.t1